MTQEKLSLDSLLRFVKAQAIAKEKSKKLAQDEATIRRQEIGDLKWPVDNSDYWTAFETRIIYERQVCDCCSGDQMCVHQELVGFRSTKQPTARRWLRHRGEALDDRLPTTTEIIERHVPQCWQCHTLERHLDNLWTILNKQQEKAI